MKKLVMILGMLVMLICPVMGEEESEFYYVEQGSITVKFGLGVGVTEANCVGLAVDAVMGLTAEKIEADLLLIRVEGELVLAFYVGSDSPEDREWLAGLCQEIHNRSFPTEHLSVCTIETESENVQVIYSSVVEEGGEAVGAR